MSNLVPFTITALSRQDIVDTPTDRNIVVGAVVTCQDALGAAVTMYDDAEGANGSTSKTTGINGQVTVFVEAGEYTFFTNGRGNKVILAPSRPVTSVTSVERLRVTRGRRNGEQISLTSYYAGWAATVAGPQGGGNLVWDAASEAVDNGEFEGANFQVTGVAVGRWRRKIEGAATPEMFGARANLIADDKLAIQAAIDYMSSLLGGIVELKQAYRTTGTVFLNGLSVTLKGAYPHKIFTSSIDDASAGHIFADFTEGPAVLVAEGGSVIDGLTVRGSASRRAAAITTGPRNVNCGVLVQPLDNGSDIIQSVEIKNLFCLNQPADGLLIEGDVTNVDVTNFYSINTGRHGIAISDGTISGATNRKAGGIFTIKKGKSVDCGGHGICVGAPGSSGYPYRVTIINREGFRNANDADVRYSTANNFIIGQDVTTIDCAFGGSGDGNLPTRPGLEVGGRDINILNSRFVSCQDNYVIIRQQSGFSTYNIKIDGGTCSTVGATPPANFATIAAGANGIEIKRVRHDGANRITTIAVGGTNDNVTLHDIDSNETVYKNHTYDFSGSVIRGLSSNGTNLVASSGAVAITRPGYYRVDTEGAAASDIIDTITGGQAGDVIILKQNNSGRVVTLDHGPGNIRLEGAADFNFLNTSEFIQLMYDGTNWYQIAPSVRNTA